MIDFPAFTLGWRVKDSLCKESAWLERNENKAWYVRKREAILLMEASVRATSYVNAAI